jgi:hypothetical protein
MSPYSRYLGLLHRGSTGSLFNPGGPPLANEVSTINAFNRANFSTFFCGSEDPPYCDELATLNQFVHELDWLIGPLVGCPMTISTVNVLQALGTAPPPACDLACTDPQATLTCMEQQAGKANSAVAVHAWLGGMRTGFWFDPTVGGYREEPDGAGDSLSRSELLGLLSGSSDRLVFQAVPLGSQRRIAHPDGAPQPLPAGSAPSQIALLPMTPNSFYQRVSELHQNWRFFDNDPDTVKSAFVHSMRLLQWGLIQDAAGQNGFGFGIDLHHDAPRRLRVAGEDIRDGAQLILLQHADPTGGPPNPAGGPDQFATRQIVLPLYATDDTTPEGLPIWETALELEPLVYYSWMMGGPEAPNVTAALTDYDFTQITLVDPVLDQPPVGTFDPVNWNLLYVRVENTDGGVGAGGWQPLQLE